MWLPPSLCVLWWVDGCGLQELLEQRPYFWLDLVVVIAVSEASSILRGWDPASKTFASKQEEQDQPTHPPTGHP